jgi:hypothetical protein
VGVGWVLSGCSWGSGGGPLGVGFMLGECWVSVGWVLGVFWVGVG